MRPRRTSKPHRASAHGRGAWYVRVERAAWPRVALPARPAQQQMRLQLRVGAAPMQELLAASEFSRSRANPNELTCDGGSPLRATDAALQVLSPLILLASL